MRRGTAPWILMALFALVTVGCSEADLGADEPRKVAPAFEVVRLDGLPVALEALRGRTVLVDFWATWCAPCEVQMPVLDAIWQARGGEDLLVLGLSMDTDPPAEVEAWLEEKGIGYPIAIADQQLAVEFGAWAYPTLVVVDPDGRIFHMHQGVMSRPELEAVLDAVANEFPG